MKLSINFFEEFYNLLRPYEILSKTNFRKTSAVKNLREFSIAKCKDLMKNFELPDVSKELKEVEKFLSESEPVLSPESAKKVYEMLKSAFESCLQSFIETSLYILSKKVSSVKGIGDNLEKSFSEKGVHSVRDLMFFFPKHYQDRRRLFKISELKEGIPSLVKGKVLEGGIVNYSTRRVYQAVITDGTGFLTLKWFHFKRKVMEEMLQSGKEYYFYGVPRAFGRRFEIVHPEVSKAGNDAEGIISIYREIKGTTQKHIRKVVKEVISRYKGYILSAVPPSLERSYSLPSLSTAVEKLHFPEDGNVKVFDEGQSIYHKRILFEEIFMLEYALLSRKKLITNLKGVKVSLKGELIKKVMERLPFELTRAQKRVLTEIEEDLKRGKLIHRLIQGDVGSGKTVVVFLASLYFIEDGYQVAMMVPTEILAIQHYRTISRYLEGTGIKVAVLTRGVKEKGEIKEKIKKGAVQFIIGTHTLIQESISFKNLALVIVDEQHRFGVLQRATLKKKGESPHLIVMSATPIPRTLAMTLYGDLDVSIIDELPPGRQPVKTSLFHYREIERVWEKVRSELQKGGSVFVVYPLIEESEKLDLRAAKEMFEKIKKEIFPEVNVGFIHGRMKEVEKREIMEKFRKGDIRILVSTTVVEVGVDVPSATLMVVEHAERFGLSQLHQLRGRVGRGEKPAECILLTKERVGEKAWRRLSIMVETNDGFRIADEDLKIRGPGEILGTRQWGMKTSEVVKFLGDVKILKKAREAVVTTLSENSRVPWWEKVIANEVVKHYKGDMLELGTVG